MKLKRISLNGEWLLRWEDGERGDRLKRILAGEADWERAWTARVPGSVHETLIAHGVIPEDPSRYYQASSPFSPNHEHPNPDTSGDQHPWSLGFPFAWRVCVDLDGGLPLGENFFDILPGVPVEMPWPEEWGKPKVAHVGNELPKIKRSKS